MLSSFSLYTNYLLLCMYHIYTAMNFDSSIKALTLFTNLTTYWLGSNVKLPVHAKWSGP